MKRYRFSREERLLKRREFVELSQKGKKIQNYHFLALYKRNDKNRSRLGITVTKKVGNAATRNKIKRYCREFFRLNKDCISENIDINIIAKAKATYLDGKETFRKLEDIFRKI